MRDRIQRSSIQVLLEFNYFKMFVNDFILPVLMSKIITICSNGTDKFSVKTRQESKNFYFNFYTKLREHTYTLYNTFYDSIMRTMSMKMTYM